MIERIYIPTVRRANNQITFNNLPDELKKKVIMVVEPTERHLYNYDCQYLEIPPLLMGKWTQLAETRLFIHKHAGAIKYVQADDDLIIKRRNEKYWTGVSNMATSKRNATEEEILSMFVTFDKWMDEEDIGVVGPSDCHAPPSGSLYSDTRGIFGLVFYDGRMISREIDNMDITPIRVASDVLFIYECLSRGINTRLSTEWTFDNRSVTRELSNTRILWEGMYKKQPADYFQTDEHYDALRYIQGKFPFCMKIYERNGRRKNTKYWKRAYNPKAGILPRR